MRDSSGGTYNPYSSPALQFLVCQGQAKINGQFSFPIVVRTERESTAVAELTCARRTSVLQFDDASRRVRKL